MKIESDRSEYLANYREENKEHLQKLSREWKMRNPDKMRNTKFKLRYGITLQDYDLMLDSQNGGCAICGSSDPKRKLSKHLCVDHCHSTGAVRGLLCYKCNVGLGAFEDNKKSLENAIKYLGGSNG